MEHIVYLAADHRGHALKERVEKFLRTHGVDVRDLTPHFDEDDDYPVVAAVLTEKIQEQPHTRGVLACGSGVGMVIAANRFKGIRAALGIRPDHVLAARHDDDVNVLVLAADFTDDVAVEKMLVAFIKGPFAQDEPRYRRRIQELDQLTS